MKRGQRLIAEVRATRAPARACAVWWMGQQSFVIKEYFVCPHYLHYLGGKRL